VLSTLHCDDSVDAVQRLLDLGMHPHSIGSELQAVIAQRLAKRICASCRVETDPDPVLGAEVFPSGPAPGTRSTYIFPARHGEPWRPSRASHPRSRP